MKMKNRKLVFGGQGGGHGRSSTSLDRWGDFYNLWDLANFEMPSLVIFSVLAYWVQKNSSVTENQLWDHLKRKAPIRSRQFNWCLQKVNTRSSEGCLRPLEGLALEDVNGRGQQSCSVVLLSWCFSATTKNADVSPACLVAAFPIWNFEPIRGWPLCVCLVLKHPNGLGGEVDLSQCLHMSFVFACAYIFLVLKHVCSSVSVWRPSRVNLPNRLLKSLAVCCLEARFPHNHWFIIQLHTKVLNSDAAILLMDLFLKVARI